MMQEENLDLMKVMLSTFSIDNVLLLLSCNNYFDITYSLVMKQQQERWVSGLNHRFAKPAKEAIPSEGSNPSLSAINS